MKALRSTASKAYCALAAPSKKVVKRHKTVRSGSLLTVNMKEALDQLVRKLTLEKPLGVLLEVEIPAGVSILPHGLGLDWGFTMKRRHLDVVGRYYPPFEDIQVALVEIRMVEGRGGILDKNTGKLVKGPVDEEWEKRATDLRVNGPQPYIEYAEADAKFTRALFQQYNKEDAARRPAGALK